MSDNISRPGSNRKSPRQLHTTVGKAPRRLRLAGLASLIAVAGTAGLVAATVPASASTDTVTDNPTCTLPAGLSWQISYQGVVEVHQKEVTVTTWDATQSIANGSVTYYGQTRNTTLNPTQSEASGLYTVCSDLTITN
jgi:hypothetical protein